MMIWNNSKDKRPPFGKTVIVVKTDNPDKPFCFFGFLKIRAKGYCVWAATYDGFDFPFESCGLWAECPPLK